MAILNMTGPYKLTNEKIDEVIVKISAGNYALGKITKESFDVYYVGRSDDDVNKALKQWVGEYPNKYVDFKFSYADSPKAAYEKECKNYHDFGGDTKLDNQRESHPKCPAGTNLKCPMCGA
jgi:hypothetical protein